MLKLSIFKPRTQKFAGAYLFLLGGCEVVFYVERLADLLRRFALDHVRYGFTRHVQQTLDVQVVRSLRGESQKVIPLDVQQSFDGQFLPHVR